MPWSPSISVGRLTTSGREPAELSPQQIHFSLSTEMPKNLSDCIAHTPKNTDGRDLGTITTCYIKPDATKAWLR